MQFFQGAHAVGADAGFLVFAGAGSMTLARQATPQAAVKRAVTAIVVITLIYQALLPLLFATTLAWNDVAKIAITLMLIAPLAYFMGRPYPAPCRLSPSARRS